MATGSLSEVRETLSTGVDSRTRAKLRARNYGSVAESAGKVKGMLGPVSVRIAKRLEPIFRRSSQVLIAVDLGYNGYKIFAAESDEEQIRAIAQFGASAASTLVAVLCLSTAISGPVGAVACFALPIASGYYLETAIDKALPQKRLP